MASVDLKAHFLVLLATVLVAGSFIATQKLAGLIDPFSIILLRFFAAALFLAPFVLLNSKHRKNIITTMPRAMIISLFYAGYFVLMFVALEDTTALNTGALYTLVPLVTAVLCIFFYKEKITINQSIVYLIGIVGTCGVVFKGNLELFLSFTLNGGDYIYIISLFFMAFYSISMKSLYKGDDLILLVFCTLLGGAIWMASILLFMDTPLHWDKIQNEMVWYMAYLVIVTTLITLYLYQKATIMLGPKSVMSYIYLNPAAVALIAFFMYEEKISLEVILSIIITMIATVILQIKINKAKVEK